MRPFLAILLCSTGLVLTGCIGDDPNPNASAEIQPFDEAAANTLSLRRVPGEPSVELVYQAPAEPSARVMELFLRVPEGLGLEGHSPGAAAEVAQKQLVVQAQDDGRLRIILYSGGNLNALGSGTLAILRFSVHGGIKRATVALESDHQIFAPQAANEGLRVSDPLELIF